MRKKKETSDNEKQTSEENVARPRSRAKLIKKRQNQTSIKALHDDPKSPHLINWGGIDSHPDTLTAPFDEKIAVRAYERFLERGGQHGQDLQDWLEAEREVRALSQCS